jgi:peptidoglycan/LPS O-acetylase OafA/YrhL
MNGLAGERGGTVLSAAVTTMRGQEKSVTRGARMAVIDGLRLLVALFVACYHYLGTTDAVKVWGAPPADLFGDAHLVTSYGWLGVEMFFVISGFVICMSSWGRSPGDFFRSRVTRLFPAYWPAVLITATVLTLWPARRPSDWHTVLVNLTMLNGPLHVTPVDTVYWTLWVEARFYLLFAVVLLWRGGLTRTRATLFGYGWLLAGLIAAAVGDSLLKSLFQPDYAPYFVVGIALYLIHRFGSRPDLWALATSSYLLMMAGVADRTVKLRGAPYEPLSPLVSMAVMTVFCAVLAAVALGWTTRIRWRWLTTAGALTYPFYLLHFGIGWVLLVAMRDLFPRYVTFALVVAIMLAASWLLHRLIERPLTRAIKKALHHASSAVRDAPLSSSPRLPASVEGPARQSVAATAHR